jgi:hypothetical protein
VKAICYALMLFIRDTVALMLIGAIILLAAAAWQYAWSADTGKGCEAATMILLAERQRARQAYRQDCLEASGQRDNQFAKLMCEPPA